jgi:hypothetical protein
MPASRPVYSLQMSDGRLPGTRLLYSVSEDLLISQVMVVPTDEELCIAQETIRVIDTVG